MKRKIVFATWRASRPPSFAGRVVAATLTAGSLLGPLANVERLAAQSAGAVAGRVTSASGDVLDGACVALEASPVVRACTGPEGTYLLQGVPAGPARVRFDAPGYTVVDRDLEIPEAGLIIVDVALVPQQVNLEEITVSAGRRRESGATVGSVEGRVITDRDGIAQALRDAMAGVRGASGGGQVGAGLGVRARGVTTVTGRLSPLVYVDGIRLGTSPVPTPEGANQSMSILSTINPADVERVEVLRGAAATARYGMEASSGVILIYTRRGGE